jgi:hypothetical protein
MSARFLGRVVCRLLVMYEMYDDYIKIKTKIKRNCLKTKARKMLVYWKLQ